MWVRMCWWLLDVWWVVVIKVAVDVDFVVVVGAASVCLF